MRTLGDRLRSARVARGLSQDELADLLGVSKTTVSDWERGRMDPRVGQLPGLRVHLEISLDDLVCGDQEMRNVVRGHHAIQESRALTPYMLGEDARPQSIAEARMLRRYRTMEEKKQRALLALLDEDQP